MALLAEIEPLQIEPDLPAKVVIDDRSGVILIGRDVRVAVAQGNLTVTINETPQVSQPSPFSRGRTRVVPCDCGGGGSGRAKGASLGAAPDSSHPPRFLTAFLTAPTQAEVTRH